MTAFDVWANTIELVWLVGLSLGVVRLWLRQDDARRRAEAEPARWQQAEPARGGGQAEGRP